MVATCCSCRSRVAWRADLQCRATDDVEEFDDEVGVRRWIGEVLPDRYADRVQWVSTYQFLQVVADRFTDEHRRVLLVGEAAHLFAPFGARGLNSGVPDARVAARAVAASRAAFDPAVAHHAIDEFATARRAAAEYNRDAASRALRAMRASDIRTRLRRRLAVDRARRGRHAGAWLDAAPYGPARASGRPTPSTNRGTRRCAREGRTRVRRPQSCCRCSTSTPASPSRMVAFRA